MHRNIIVAIAVSAVLVSLGGLLPGATMVAALLALAVAVLGVPHGGLDHWSGRRRIAAWSRSVGPWWPLLFFPAYGSVAVLVVAAWHFFPVLTLIGFVVMSARHFGLEDGHENMIPAIGWGGCILWIPALFRGTELQGLMGMVMPTLSPSELAMSLTALRCIGLFAILAATVWALRTGARIGVMPGVWMMLAAATPVPVSFGIYFCGWHSIRGLDRLRTENEQTWGQLVVAVAPLTVAAIGLIVAGGVWLSRGAVLDAAITQTLFIGLSAIAVPHMILHEPSLAGFPRSVGELEATHPQVAP